MADHCHIFWCCPVIQPYWLGVLKEINTILRFEIVYNFKTDYLRNLPDDLNSQDKYLLKMLLIASKKPITRNWLNREPPMVEWSATVKNVHEMEMMTFSLRLNNEPFFGFLNFLFTFHSSFSQSETSCYKK